MDVDIFKSVNDTYGHATGDATLKKVSSLLKRAFRSVDYVCRIGGDEFAIVLVEMTSDPKYTIQEKITAVNQELSEPTDGLPAVSLSVGVAFPTGKTRARAFSKMPIKYCIRSKNMENTDVVSMEKKKQKNKHKNIRRGMERFRVLFRIFLL